MLCTWPWHLAAHHWVAFQSLQEKVWLAFATALILYFAFVLLETLYMELALNPCCPLGVLAEVVKLSMSSSTPTSPLLLVCLYRRISGVFLTLYCMVGTRKESLGTAHSTQL